MIIYQNNPKIKENTAFVLEKIADAKKGDKISFSFAEILDKDGNFYNKKTLFFLKFSLTKRKKLIY